jgi:hypothetical protein
MQQRNLAHDALHERVKEQMKESMLQRMSELKDEFRECSWYGKHWTKDRIVLRGAMG